jgi:uncharacterized membrane protein
MKEGDAAANGAKALLASRTNVLFSAPMAFGMLASGHGAAWGGSGYGSSVGGLDLMICLAIILLLEVNALIGKQGPIASVKGVIHGSLTLTALLFGVLYYI